MAGGWAGVDPDLAEAAKALMQVVSDAGGMPTITSTVRTYEQQAYLWKRYQQGQSGGLPAAPPGHSAHEYGWAFDMVVSPREWQSDVGRVWTSWGGVYGAKRDPVHFELPGAGQAAWALGEQSVPLSSAGKVAGTGRTPPAVGGSFYKLADFLSSFVPGLGAVQLVDQLVSAFDGNNDMASWYLQHPAEAIRDLLGL